jgi:hypothetical protein
VAAALQDSPSCAGSFNKFSYSFEVKNIFPPFYTTTFIFYFAVTLDKIGNINK